MTSISQYGAKDPPPDENQHHSLSINIRLTPSEAQSLADFRARLQVKHGKHVRVTNKAVFLEALERLDADLRKEDGIQPS